MFVLKISVDNDAFQDDKRGEISRILSELSEKIDRGLEPSRLIDVNGNVCGSVDWSI